MYLSLAFFLPSFSSRFSSSGLISALCVRMYVSHALEPFINATRFSFSVQRSAVSRKLIMQNRYGIRLNFYTWLGAPRSPGSRPYTTHPVRYLGHTWILNHVMWLPSRSINFSMRRASVQTPTKYNSKCQPVCHRSRSYRARLELSTSEKKTLLEAFHAIFLLWKEIVLIIPVKVRFVLKKSIKSAAFPSSRVILKDNIVTSSR